VGTKKLPKRGPKQRSIKALNPVGGEGEQGNQFGGKYKAKRMEKPAGEKPVAGRTAGAAGPGGEEAEL